MFSQIEGTIVHTVSLIIPSYKSRNEKIGSLRALMKMLINYTYSYYFIT